MARALRHVATILNSEVAQHDVDPALDLLERATTAYTDLDEALSEDEINKGRLDAIVDDLAAAVIRGERELAPWIKARAAQECSQAQPNAEPQVAA